MLVAVRIVDGAVVVACGAQLIRGLSSYDLDGHLTAAVAVVVVYNIHLNSYY